MTEYTVEPYKEGGEGAGVKAVLGREVQIDAVRDLYRMTCKQYSGRLVMLCDRARVLARSESSR